MLKLPNQKRRKTGGSRGYRSPSYLTGLVQGARRWSLLIIKALGEASRRLPVLVKSAVQQRGSKQGKATSACLPGKKLVGRESVLAVVIFACNKEKHSRLSERELSAQPVEQRPKQHWSCGSPLTVWKVWPCYMTSPHVLTLWPPCHPREGIKQVRKKNVLVRLQRKHYQALSRAEMKNDFEKDNWTCCNLLSSVFQFLSACSSFCQSCKQVQKGGRMHMDVCMPGEHACVQINEQSSWTPAWAALWGIFSQWLTNTELSSGEMHWKTAVQADGRSMFCLEACTGEALDSTGILWMHPTGDGSYGWGLGKPQAKKKEFLYSDAIKGIGLTARPCEIGTFLKC